MENFKFITVPYVYNQIGRLPRKSNPSLVVVKEDLHVKIPVIPIEDTQVVATIYKSNHRLNSVRIDKYYEYRLYNDELYINIIDKVALEKEIKKTYDIYEDNNIYTYNYGRDSNIEKDDLIKKQLENFMKAKTTIDYKVSDLTTDNITKYTEDCINNSIHKTKENAFGKMILYSKEEIKDPNLLDPVNWDNQDVIINNTNKMTLGTFNTNMLISKQKILKNLKETYDNIIEIDGKLYMKTDVPVFIQYNTNKDKKIYYKKSINHLSRTKNNKKDHGSIMKNSLILKHEKILQYKDLLEIDNNFYTNNNCMNISNNLISLNLFYQKNNKDKDKDKKVILFYLQNFPEKIRKNLDFKISFDLFREKNNEEKLFIEKFSSEIDNFKNSSNEKFYFENEISMNINVQISFPDTIIQVDPYLKDYLNNKDLNTKWYSLFVNFKSSLDELDKISNLFTYDFCSQNISKLFDLLKRLPNEEDLDYLDELSETILFFKENIQNGLRPEFKENHKISYEEYMGLFDVQPDYHGIPYNNQPLKGRGMSQYDYGLAYKNIKSILDKMEKQINKNEEYIKNTIDLENEDVVNYKF
jgi:hypothetical protein